MKNLKFRKFKGKGGADVVANLAADILTPTLCHSDEGGLRGAG